MTTYQPVPVSLSLSEATTPGFDIRFPYSDDAVKRIKLALGTHWVDKQKVWRTDGPEVLLDFERFGITISEIEPEARVMAEEFRSQLWESMDHRSEDFGDELYGYQRQGANWMASLPNVILADDMGTGKTKQSLDAAAIRLADFIVVLCPKTLTYNWKNEVEKWHPEWSVEVLPDSKNSHRKRDGRYIKGRDEFWRNPPQVVIANYEKTLSADWPFQLRPAVLIMDEGSRLKNSTTATYKSVKRIIRRADCSWILTGTPLEMRVQEIYSLLGLLRPAVLGSFMRFVEQHCEKDWSDQIIGVKNLDLLRDRIGPFMLRRTKAEVLSMLPPKLPPQLHFVRLTEQELEAYQTFKDEFNNWLTEHGVSGGGDALIQSLRMRQFCATPDLFTSELGKGSKFEALQEIIDGWDGRVMIFCFFEQVIDRLHRWLNVHPRALISGTDNADSEERIKRATEFSEGKLGKVFVSTDAGGMGINVTGADLIIHYDQLWNPQKMNQREDRLHRIGQENPVHVIHMLCMETIDYGMYLNNLDLRQLFTDVVDGAEQAMLAKLNVGRLRRIIDGRI